MQKRHRPSASSDSMIDWQIWQHLGGSDDGLEGEGSAIEEGFFWERVEGNRMELVVMFDKVLLLMLLLFLH